MQADEYLKKQDQDLKEGTEYILRVVNFPEIFVVSPEGDPDKELLYESLKYNDIELQDYFLVSNKTDITKRYIPKHMIFWNTKYNVYEKFTLQTFKFMEGGKERIEGMWVGTHDGESKQLDYISFFDALKDTHLELVLMVWETLEVLNVRIKETPDGLKQDYKVTLVEDNPDKFQ